MKRIISTSNAPQPIGPYSQAVQVGNTVYLSGQIAINPQSGELLIHDLDVETKQVMENLKSVLSAANLDFSHVVKTGIFLKSMSDFPRVNEIYARYFTDDFPARETVEVAGLPKGVNVEISMIAVAND